MSISARLSSARREPQLTRRPVLVGPLLCGILALAMMFIGTLLVVRAGNGTDPHRTSPVRGKDHCYSLDFWVLGIFMILGIS